MAAQSPEEVDRLFAQALNAGDLDALVALYEPAAAFAPPGGQPVSGHAAIRASFVPFMPARPRMSLTPRVLLQTADLALVRTQWRLEMTGQDGQPATANGESIEVMRRQPDGRWLLALDVPAP